MKLLLALVLAISACAPGLDGARQTIANTALVLNASAHAFEQYDAQHQQTLAQPDQGTLTDRNIAISAYRAKREIVLKAFSSGLVVLTTANALIPLVENGTKDKNDLSAMLNNLYAAASQIQSALTALGVLGGNR